ncbi:hypothetical protein M2396_001178 [Pseudomonas sp. BIGb0278]|nr:hypothetical protein [Pseudomonas sp. BIGb0278]
MDGNSARSRRTAGIKLKCWSWGTRHVIELNDVVAQRCLNRFENEAVYAHTSTLMEALISSVVRKPVVSDENLLRSLAAGL